jgi:hypothetical protein
VVRNEKSKKKLATSTTQINQTTNLNDEAAGRLNHTDLHCIITAALEGKQKHQHACRALANNYASLMSSFKMKFHSEKNQLHHPFSFRMNVNTLKMIQRMQFHYQK